MLSRDRHPRPAPRPRVGPGPSRCQACAPGLLPSSQNRWAGLGPRLRVGSTLPEGHVFSRPSCCEGKAAVCGTPVPGGRRQKPSEKVPEGGAFGSLEPGLLELRGAESGLLA